MKRKKIWPIIVAVELAFVALFFASTPWLVSHMNFDPEQAQHRSKEIKERATLLAKKKEKIKELPMDEDVLKKLSQSEERKFQKKMVQHLKKMLEVQEQVKRERQLREEMISRRNKKDVLKKAVQKFDQILEQLKFQANVLEKMSKDDRTKDITNHVQQLEQLKKQLGETGEQKNLGELEQTLKDLKTTADSLRSDQEAGKHSEVRDQLGEPGHTAWMQELIKDFSTELDALSKTMQAPNDVSSLPEQQQFSSDQIESMNSQQQMQMSQQLEQAINNDFSAARAMDHAMNKGLSVQQSKNELNRSIPQKKQGQSGDTPSTSGLKTLKDYANYRKQLQKSSQQASQQLASSQSLLAQLGGEAVGMQQALARAKQQSLIQSAVSSAAGGQGEGMLDLSGLMRRATRGGGAGDMGGDVTRNQKQGGYGMQQSNMSLAKPKIQTKDIEGKALPGRRFTNESERQGWLFLDTWYVIGPWENRGRINYQNQHPPEFEIDLSKTYKDGKLSKETNEARALQWEFTQSSTVKVIPPEEVADSTYYAWTEVWFDKDRDMLLAIASDDAAKVWVNQIPVWEDRGLSAWSLDEGFRKVYFKAGFNSILVRIENGPVLCSFSVLLCPTTKGS